MHALADIIITGWPDDIKEVPCPLHPYWQHLETLTIEDGLVLHGEAIIVPPSERKRILHQLHQFHQGITKSQLLMHGCIFWPGINKAIEEVLHQCETCNQFQAQNAATPLTPTPTLSCPWQMCASDIFTLEGADYLTCGDLYSKMILIQYLPSGQNNTAKVVSLLKEMFSEHGIPGTRLVTIKTMTISPHHMAVIPIAPSSQSYCSTNITTELIEVIKNPLLYIEQPCLCILDTLHKLYNEDQNKCIMLAANISVEELRINKGITICFTCVADVTEVDQDPEPIELINEVNDVDIEMKESAISKVVPKEILTPISQN